MQIPKFMRRKPKMDEPSPDEIAQGIIKQYSGSAAYAGIPGAFVPHADLLALIPMWSRMIWRLGKCYKVKLSARDSLRIAAAIVTSAGTFYGGVKTASWYFSLTGIGVVPVAAMNASLNAALTYTAGQSVASVFSRQDFDPKDLVPAMIREFTKIAPNKPRLPPKVVPA